MAAKELRPTFGTLCRHRPDGVQREETVVSSYSVDVHCWFHWQRASLKYSLRHVLDRNGGSSSPLVTYGETYTCGQWDALGKRRFSLIPGALFVTRIGCFVL
eukprot:TRINITY_DN101095_c0_g1_i1.p1 TRINITY_DN101095_c0_g1~~TRINITY_DN101095_c0_g1_i1.p1  ORF type:complete len:114 (-),score=4.15 TRINITY_DN101095_c0_g1_i1:34-339(-)